MPGADVLIVGAGQAGLAIGRALQQHGVRTLLLEAAERVGDSWRRRYDSLVLFTPVPLDELPGLPFPPTRTPFPTKDEMAGYLERYAERFALPVRLGERVLAVSGGAAGFTVRTASGQHSAPQVVIATGPYQRPRVPAFAAALPPDVAQLHSSAYRNPAQLPAGPVLVVGAANSGAQIALELAGERQTSLSMGTRLAAPPARLLRSVLAWRVARRGVMRNDPIGLPWPLGNTARFFVPDLDAQLAARGVLRLGRAEGADGRRMRFAGGGARDVGSVVWATGYVADYSWIDLPAFDDQGQPRHRGGVSDVPGLYFMGLRRQRSFGSAFVVGAGPDAAWLAPVIARRAGVSR